MFNSLKSKIIIPSIGVLLLLVVVIVVYVSVSTRGLADNLTQQRIDLAASAASARLVDFEYQTRLIASAVAGDYAVASNLLNWNANIDRPGSRNTLISHLTALSEQLGANSFVVHDAEGRIILRLHNLELYNDIDGGAPSRYGLAGVTTTGYFSTPTMPMGLQTSTPITHDGQTIGVMSAIFFLDTPAFVDAFANVFNSRVSIFAGDTSVMSTSIAADGSRAVGGQLVPEVIDIVLTQGRTHIAEISIGGVPYHGYYHPLRNLAGDAIGSVFLGFSNQAAVDYTNAMQLTLIIAGVVGLVVAGAIMLLLIMKALKPLNILTKTVKDVSDGNINVNINRTNLPKDEIGTLTHDVCGLVDVIRDMVQDLTQVEREFNTAGDIEYRVDAEKYQNSYSEMIKSINRILDSSVNDVVGILGVLNQISDGEFNVQIADMPGKKMILPQTLRTVTANLKSVSADVNGMIEAAANKGDLNFKADTDKYKGDWQKIIAGLNDIAKAVAEPITVIEICLKELQKGNFNLEEIDKAVRSAGLNADATAYSGIFHSVVSAVDVTVTEISAYIDEITNDLAAVARGDLTTVITREFLGDFAPIKESINNISVTLNKTVSEIAAASDQVLSGAKQISISAQELANGAQEQASSVEELNATIDMINQQTRQNADNAMEASEISNKSTANAQEGNASMKEMVAAMSQIKESSNEISKIIKAIQDIAFQTNLLALNAAVEAARASKAKALAWLQRKYVVLQGVAKNPQQKPQGLLKHQITVLKVGQALPKPHHNHWI